MVPATERVSQVPVVLQAIKFHWTLRDLANKRNKACFQAPVSHTVMNNTVNQARRDVVLECIPDKDPRHG